MYVSKDIDNGVFAPKNPAPPPPPQDPRMYNVI